HGWEHDVEEHEGRIIGGDRGEPGHAAGRAHHPNASAFQRQFHDLANRGTVINDNDHWLIVHTSSFGLTGPPASSASGVAPVAPACCLQSAGVNSSTMISCQAYQ